MNNEQRVHMALLSRGDLTRGEIMGIAQMSGYAARDACRRLREKGYIAAAGFKCGARIWRAVIRNLVPDLRGEGDTQRANLLRTGRPPGKPRA